MDVSSIRLALFGGRWGELRESNNKASEASLFDIRL